MKNIRLRSYKDTGSILVDHGLLEPERLDDASELQANTGFSMGRALVELGLISEWDLARAVAKELGVPFVRLKENDRLSEAALTLGPTLMRRHLVFILERFDDVDTIVVAEPPSLELLSELSGQLGNKVFILVGLISDVAGNLEKALAGVEEAPAAAAQGSSLTAEEILKGFDDG